MKMFVELPRREYYKGRYQTLPTLFSLNNIARVVCCVDDSDFTNVTTTDGTTFTIAMRYETVMRRITEGGHDD